MARFAQERDYWEHEDLLWQFSDTIKQYWEQKHNEDVARFSGEGCYDQIKWPIKMRKTRPKNPLAHPRRGHESNNQDAQARPACALDLVRTCLTLCVPTPTHAHVQTRLKGPTRRQTLHARPWPKHLQKSLEGPRQCQQPRLCPRNVQKALKDVGQCWKVPSTKPRWKDSANAKCPESSKRHWTVLESGKHKATMEGHMHMLEYQNALEGSKKGKPSAI